MRLCMGLFGVLPENVDSRVWGTGDNDNCENEVLSE